MDTLSVFKNVHLTEMVSLDINCPFVYIQQYIQDETFSIQEVSIGSLRISSGVTHMFDKL